MKHVFPSTKHLLSYSRRGALLALGAAGPVAWGQSFGPVSAYSTGAGGGSYRVAVGDINQDGRVDIITSNNGTGRVGALLNQTGGFAAARNYSTGAGSLPLGVALSDVNGDGWPDIVTTHNGAANVGVLLGQPSGGFAAVSS